MVMLVTLQQASDHIRRDTTDDDDDLILKIKGASRAIMNYLNWDVSWLNTSGEPDLDIDGNPLVPEEVMLATLKLVEMNYDNRGSSAEGQINAGVIFGGSFGYLPADVIALLYPLRTPNIA